MKKFLHALLFPFIFNTVSAQIDSVRYHDGSMESQWGSSTVNDDFGCFTRFTPSSYPAQLVGVRGFFRNADATSTFKWKVYQEPTGGGAGAVLVMYQSPSALPNPAATGTPGQQYDVYTNLTADSIVLTTGDFYIGAVQTTGFFGMGIDNAPDDSVAPDRQWQWMTVFGTNNWNMLSTQAASGQWGITAYFNSTSTLVEKIEREKPVFTISTEGVLNCVTKGHEEYTVEVFNLNGKCILQEKFNTTVQLPLQLNSGIYFVRATSGDHVFYEKLIRQ